MIKGEGMNAFFRNKRIMITGHTGFKGSWLCRVLLGAGAKITGYALKPDIKPALFDIAVKKGSIHSITGDIRDFNCLNKAFKKARPEIVIHMAAQPIVREGYRRPVYTYETNVIGTANMLECMRLSGRVRSFLNVTTDKVYENREREKSYAEGDRLCGRDPYSNSKSCSELVTLSYRKSFFYGKNAPAISTARSGNVIGGGDFSLHRILPDCVRAALAKSPIIVRNPDSVRPYQHVLECLFGYLALIEAQYRDHEKAGSYNFGPDDSGCVSTGKLASLFCDAWGEGASWKSKKDGGPHEAGLLKLDNKKAKSMLKWRPRWSIEQAVQRTVEWTKTWSRGGDAASCMDGQIDDYMKKG